jgi:hypothetical protein
MRASFRIIAVFCLLTLGLFAQPMPGADSKWKFYQSENFEMYSRNSDSDSRQLLHNLELVHAIFFETFKFKVQRTVPLTVYFFARDKHFESYKSDEMRALDSIAAVYISGYDRGVMTVAPVPDYAAAQKLAFGSYTYHLFRLAGAEAPLWYRTGVSGVMRNIVINHKSMEIGHADGPQLRSLRDAKLLPVELMFGIDQSSEIYRSSKTFPVVTNQSWALIHYFYFGQHKVPVERVANFVSFAIDSQKSYDANAIRRQFEQEFGMNYPQMNKALESYIRNGRYAFSKPELPKIPPAKSYVSRSVPIEEINSRLAELGVYANNSPQGRLTLLHAADASQASPRVHEVLGTAAFKTQDYEGGMSRWRRAIEAGSTNPALVHEMVRLENRARFQRLDLHYRLPAESEEWLRDLAQRCLEAEPLNGTAYELLAWIEATSKTPVIANLNLVQRNLHVAKDRNRMLLALAAVRMRFDDQKTALEIIDALDLDSADSQVRYGAEVIRAAIEKRPVNRGEQPARNAAPRFPVTIRPGSK